MLLQGICVRACSEILAETTPARACPCTLHLQSLKALRALATRRPLSPNPPASMFQVQAETKQQPREPAGVIAVGRPIKAHQQQRCARQHVVKTSCRLRALAGRQLPCAGAEERDGSYSVRQPPMEADGRSYMVQMVPRRREAHFPTERATCRDQCSGGVLTW